MGNNQSDVNDSLKAQAGGEGGPEIYKYINVAGGGKLITLIKAAEQNKDYTELDNFIKTDVVNYLYNNGQGENVLFLKINILKVLNRVIYIILNYRFPLKNLCLEELMAKYLQKSQVCFIYTYIYIYI